jgi:putative hydrolase of the HAD superfamily
MKAVLFDLGDTLIVEESVGDKHTAEAELQKVPFAERVLKELRGKYKLGVVTNTTTSKEMDIRMALRRIGLEQYFDVVITSVDVGREKPDERIFIVALRKLGVKPSEVVMVGNRIKTDVLGANGLGMTTVYFKWNDRYNEEVTSPLEKPTYTISSLRQLPQILIELEKGKRNGGNCRGASGVSD